MDVLETHCIAYHNVVPRQQLLTTGKLDNIETLIEPSMHHTICDWFRRSHSDKKS